MRRATEQFVCQNCGVAHGKWSGRCPACGAWNTISEEAIAILPPKGKGTGRGNVIQFHKLNQNRETEESRTASGLCEFDRE